VVQCLVPPGDINQLTINAGYKSTQLISSLLTVPRALSRIHCTTKLTLKRAAEQKEKQNLMPPRLHTAMVSQWQLQPEAHFHIWIYRQDRLRKQRKCAFVLCPVFLTTSGLR
jgi:hypothetical protein